MPQFHCSQEVHKFASFQLIILETEFSKYMIKMK